jgi:acetamidase/formamidase
MAHHRLSRDQVIWSFGPDLQAVLEVDPRDVVTFETNDCFSGQIKSTSDLVTDIDMTRLNSATGPVTVRGAQPGLARRRDHRRAARPLGRCVADSGFRQLTHLVDAAVTQMFVVRDGLVRMNERMSFPAKPMVEIAGELDVRFEALKGKQARWPVTELDDRWVPHATATDYADALQPPRPAFTRARRRARWTADQ